MPLSRLLKQIIATGRPDELPVAQAIRLELLQGAWGIAPREVIALAISHAGQMTPLGVLVAGVNPHKLLDQVHEFRTPLGAQQLIENAGALIRIPRTSSVR